MTARFAPIPFTERVIGMPLLRIMEIGEHVVYKGRPYVLRGLDPMSIEDRRAELEDLETGEHVWVPLADVREA